MGALKPRAFLLDTHTLLWALAEQEKLGEAAKRIITNAQNDLYLSAISAFEIANKQRIGKLLAHSKLVKNYVDNTKRLGTIALPLTTAHTLYAGSFEWQHRDPFDRILAAQAYLEGLTLITNDAAFADLPWVKTVW